MKLVGLVGRHHRTLGPIVAARLVWIGASKGDRSGQGRLDRARSAKQIDVDDCQVIGLSAGGQTVSGRAVFFVPDRHPRPHRATTCALQAADDEVDQASGILVGDALFRLELEDARDVDRSGGGSGDDDPGDGHRDRQLENREASRGSPRQVVLTKGVVEGDLVRGTNGHHGPHERCEVKTTR